MQSPGSPGTPRAAGWYPDPGASGSWRFWDGARWTDALSSAIPPAGPQATRDDTRSWALAAHLSALLAVFVVGLSFTGPLIVYLARKDEPFVRRHAAEALNFNLSFLIYAVALGFAALVLLSLSVGVLAVALLTALGIGWLVLVCVAATKAGRHEEHRYPLTIRFVR